MSSIFFLRGEYRDHEKEDVSVSVVFSPSHPLPLIQQQPQNDVRQTHARTGENKSRGEEDQTLFFFSPHIFEGRKTRSGDIPSLVCYLFSSFNVSEFLSVD